MIERLCIIGVGLIGGSLALALKKAGFCQTVMGIGRSANNLELALERKVIDVASHDFSTVQGADMVVLATPVGSTEKVCREIADYLDESAVFTDVGSVKKAIVKQVASAFGELPPNFVPGHPIAGNENSGAGAAIDDLFTGRRVLLTPAESTSEDALDKVRAMWQATGALVETMSIDQHDRVLAVTSHLPHMLAFGLVDSLARQEESEEIFRYAAGGFRDFTRIASSDPVMWRDICLYNREALLGAMDNYQNDLAELRSAIEASDAAVLQSIFSHAKAARDQFVNGENGDDE
ncbi:MAG: prephenate dehydrogenase/arogenate dehydrogenase family protein [Thiothrix sp.]|nr:MAG: prephenate dehydrogenase/arogenate dehydrogenase family protein [Thiothrix sp.]